ncbi:hypothetical protein CAL20_02960 [Bordetella genomosp. 4]|uniref:Uncharacterized protein n=1 Tax=Bordetella genomosp. 4 TaxID=463044 RepID=A0A261USV5_9BORD|nr:hypothetical protein CAL20_02960 [Bordetella genomosp. 4]
MTWETHQITAIVNLAICIAICGSCICRLTHVGKHDLARRARYALMVGGSVTCGLQPVLFGQWPSVATTVFAGCILLNMMINASRWRRS